MKAVGIESFEEGPKVLEVDVPEPGPGEILVRVSHSSLNGFDVAVASGMYQNFMEHRFPLVLGKDFAGTVEETGEGVTLVSPGDTVFGELVREYVGDGTFAEYVVVPEAIGLAKVPDGLDRATAGALALAGTTAYQAVTAVGPTAGDIVLVSGATGGVGSNAMQLAASNGAIVIATARPGEEAEFVDGLGAHHTVDYSGDIAGQVRAVAPNGVDAVVHFAGDGVQLADLLRAGGRFASSQMVGSDQLGDRDIEATSIMHMPYRETLDELASRAAGGKLRVPIERTYKLDEVPQAIRDFAQQGKLGKLAVTIE
jgi:NADPH:quinone reductase-like Zn-dependent oxidoreductase